MTVSFTHPHEPYQSSHRHWTLYDHDDIDMPAAGPLPDLDPYSRRLLAQYGLADLDVTDDQIRNARHGYYGAVSYVDDLVGSLLQTLSETSLGDNTVVVFSTDHGDMLGERGMWYKRTFFEEVSRSPLIVSWPGTFAPGRVSANVSLVDLLPTPVELAGNAVEPVDDLAGASRVSLCDDPAAPSDDIVYGENLSESANAPILMVKRGTTKYIWSGCDPAQLLDLAADPLELTNLAGDPAYAEAQTELDALLHKRWDVDDLGARIEESQRRRSFLRTLYAGGNTTEWRTPPADQASRHILPEGEIYSDWAYGNILA